MIGGEYVEALLVSPEHIPFKNLEVCKLDH